MSDIKHDATKDPNRKTLDDYPLLKWEKAVWSDGRLSTHAKALAACLRTMHMDANGYCYPGHRKLVEETREARATVKRAINQLRDHGYLIVNPGRRAGKTSEYTASLPSSTILSEDGVLEVPGGAVVVSRPVPVVPRGVAHHETQVAHTELPGSSQVGQNGVMKREQERDHRSRSTNKSLTALVEEAEEPRPYIAVPGDCDHLYDRA